MIVVLKPGVGAAEVEMVAREVRQAGYEPRIIHGVELTVIAAVGDERSHGSLEALMALEPVQQVVPVQKQYKLASRSYRPADTVIESCGEQIGGGTFHVMAGPCSVEGRDQLFALADTVRAAGATFLRGGAYKPRTSPYDFQGMRESGLEILSAARARTGLGVVTEVLSQHDVEVVARHADILQIGTRNAQNYALLQEVAASGKPILLKRGWASKIEEWLLAAEYLLVHGNPRVILCERGIRTFETVTRNTLDLAAVALAKRETHLPVVVDPSQGVGRRDLVEPMSLAGLAAGADGLLIEVHQHPEQAWSDGPQQITPGQLMALMDRLAALAPMFGKALIRRTDPAAVVPEP